MQQNNTQRQQRYIVNWNTSNQNKKYTIQEKQFIKQCYEKGISPMSIAKQLKRGLWAIEVQIMYLKNNHRNNHRAPTTFYPRNRSHGSHRPQTQHLKKQQQQKIQREKQQQAPQQEETQNWGNIKPKGKRNRKFNTESSIIQTKENEMQAHVYKLMCL